MQPIIIKIIVVLLIFMKIIDIEASYSICLHFCNLEMLLRRKDVLCLYDSAHNSYLSTSGDDFCSKTCSHIGSEWFVLYIVCICCMPFVSRIHRNASIPVSQLEEFKLMTALKCIHLILNTLTGKCCIRI